jgi:hypothetical protein
MRSVTLALFILLQVLLLFVVRHDTQEIDSRPGTALGAPLQGGVCVGQTFKAPAGGLARIDVLFGTEGGTADGEIRFRLREPGSAGVPAVEIVFDASSLRNNLYRTFRFPSRRDSRGRTYLFELESAAPAASGGVAVRMHARDVYKDGEALLNGAPTGGDLAFRAYSRSPVWTEFPRMARRGNGPFRSVFLLAAAVLLFEAAAIVLLIKLLDSLRKE